MRHINYLGVRVRVSVRAMRAMRACVHVRALLIECMRCM